VRILQEGISSCRVPINYLPQGVNSGRSGDPDRSWVRSGQKKGEGPALEKIFRMLFVARFRCSMGRQLQEETHHAVP
jgi:hypothetical protein